MTNKPDQEKLLDFANDLSLEHDDVLLASKDGIERAFYIQMAERLMAKGYARTPSQSIENIPTKPIDYSKVDSCGVNEDPTIEHQQGYKNGYRDGTNIALEQWIKKEQMRTDVQLFIPTTDQLQATVSSFTSFERFEVRNIVERWAPVDSRGLVDACTDDLMQHLAKLATASPGKVSVVGLACNPEQLTAYMVELGLGVYDCRGEGGYHGGPLPMSIEAEKILAKFGARGKK